MKSIVKQHVITVLCSLAFVPTVMGKKPLSPEGQDRYDKAVNAVREDARRTYNIYLRAFRNESSDDDIAKLNALLAASDDIAKRKTLLAAIEDIAKRKALLAAIEDVEQRTNEKSSDVFQKARKKLSIYNEELKQYKKIHDQYQKHLEACNNDRLTRGNKYIQRDIQEKIDLYARQIKDVEEWKKPLIMQCALYKPKSEYHQEVKNALADLILKTGLMTQDSDTYLHGNLSRQNLVSHCHQKSPSIPEKKMVSLVMKFYPEIKALERSQSVPNSPVVEHERPLRHSKSLEEDKWVQDTGLPVGLFSNQQPDHVEAPRPQYPD